MAKKIAPAQEQVWADSQRGFDQPYTMVGSVAIDDSAAAEVVRVGRCVHRIRRAI